MYRRSGNWGKGKKKRGGGGGGRGKTDPAEAPCFCRFSIEPWGRAPATPPKMECHLLHLYPFAEQGAFSLSPTHPPFQFFFFFLWRCKGDKESFSFFARGSRVSLPL